MSRGQIIGLARGSGRLKPDVDVKSPDETASSTKSESQRLNRLRKKCQLHAKFSKSVPQGPKATLILLYFVPGLKPRPTSPSPRDTILDIFNRGCYQLFSGPEGLCLIHSFFLR